MYHTTQNDKGWKGTLEIFNPPDKSKAALNLHIPNQCFFATTDNSPCSWLCGILSAVSWILAPKRQCTSKDSFSGQQKGVSVPLNRESLTTSIWHLFLQALQVVNTVSPCRSCSWVSIIVTALYLSLVVKLDDGDWSPAFVGHQRPKSLIFSDVYYWNMIVKQPVSLLVSLILHGFLIASCNSTTYFKGLFTYAHLMQVFTLSLGESSRHSVQLATFTESLFLPVLYGWICQIPLWISLKEHQF